MDQKTRTRIKEACFFFGRPKTVAINAGVDISNFSKWLRGNATLSEPNVGLVLKSIGLPNFEPDLSRVHIWHITTVPMTGITSVNVAAAFSLYMPQGGQIARAPLGKKGVSNLNPLQAEAVYALTDGRFRAVLRLVPGVQLQASQIKAPIKWRGGTEVKSHLNLSEPVAPWSEGTPTIDEFDRLWSDHTPPATVDDIRAAARKVGISYADVVDLIRNSKPNR
ncbi:hypothetical protein KFF05_00530 [bacterium SCSIO 12827]|nr:hypothetical protein KFF05_00530 [bacterium SCSIO 12827]